MLRFTFNEFFIYTVNETFISVSEDWFTGFIFMIKFEWEFNSRYISRHILDKGLKIEFQFRISVCSG